MGKSRISGVIVVLGFVSFFTDMSSHMIVPILPLYLANVLNVQVASIGVIEGIAECTASLLKLFSGWIADRVGRRKGLMIAGYGLSNLLKPFFAVSASWTHVLLLRFADRLGKGIRVSPRDALVADSTTKEERGRAFGFRRSMDALGAAMGPLAAFLILAWQADNYRLVFWLSAVPGVAAMLLLFIGLKEKRKDRSAVKAQLPRLFAFRSFDRRYIRFCVIFTLFTLGNFSDAFLALRAQDAGMAATLIPLAFFLFNIVSSAASGPVGGWSDRIGRRPVMLTGLVIFAVIYMGFGLAPNAAWMWVLFGLYGLYYAFTEGIQKAYIADIVPEGARGTAMGTFNALTGLAALPSSIMAGVLWNAFSPAAAFGTSSVLALLAAVLMVLWRV